MLKKFTAVLLSAFIVVLSIPFIKSNATDVTVEGTFGDIINGLTIDDMLSRENYNLYYDTVENGLKNAVVNTFIGDNVDSTLGSTIFTDITNTWNNNQWQTISFYPDVSGKYLFFFFVGPNYTPLFDACTIVSNDDVFVIGNSIVSSSPFDFYWVDYSYRFDNSGMTYSPYIYNGDSKHNVQSSYNSTYNYYYIDTNGYLFYSDLPVYFLYNFDSNYQDLLYLGESPYDYETFMGVYNAVINNSDDTGFIVDRRSIAMSGGSNPSGQIVSIDYDENLFEGVLGFNWFNPSATLNYNNHTQLYYPYFMFNYQINNYTNIHKSSCSIVIESSIGLCLRYNMDGSPYQTISHFSNNKTLLLTDNLETFTIYGSDQGQGNTWTNTSLRTTRGFNTSTGLNPFEGDLTDDIKTALSQYGTNGNIDYANSYATFTVNFYIRDNVTGNTSETYQAIFDMFQNNYKDNKNELVSNDNQEFIDFKNSFDYQQNGDDLTPVNYANDVSGGQGGSSIVTITNPQFPYLLVDIPEGEWMSKTPNLTTILTDFKDALSEIKEDSILNVMSETYNYIPVPMWQYLTYGVSILLAIGIWRGITRR